MGQLEGLYLILFLSYDNNQSLAHSAYKKWEKNTNKNKANKKATKASPSDDFFYCFSTSLLLHPEKLVENSFILALSFSRTHYRTPDGEILVHTVFPLKYHSSFLSPKKCIVFSFGIQERSLMVGKLCAYDNKPLWMETLHSHSQETSIIEEGPFKNSVN